MDDFILARVVHVLAVLLWIGGVAFVTTVALPAIRRNNPPDARLAAFHLLEQRFARQAQVWVLLAGASGFWMAWRADLWARFADPAYWWPAYWWPAYWWIAAMVAVWTIFATMLFVLEPLVIHRRMSASRTPARDFARMETMHRILLAASLITTAGAVAGSHGWS